MLPGWQDSTVVLVETGLLLSPGTLLYAAPPAAQRQWRGLTDKEFEVIIMSAPNATVPVMLWQLIQDKLKEKNS